MICLWVVRSNECRLIKLLSQHEAGTTTHLNSTGHIFTDGDLVFVPIADWNKEIETVFFIYLQ